MQSNLCNPVRKMNTQSKTYPYIQVLRRDRDVLYDIIMYGIYLRLHN